ncbi:hypothetical protein VSR69_16585 [Paraburkholderia phytofirmans]|jgi:hypothetical protein|uniref:hypothetical protein n=1 Tax=Paraburkholderia sp. BL9I2N2 TaxID=1938809 RepID=UPI0010465B5D|nr:hypothetical protein [Paraburkholderia sp. BL9I2N2]TCK94750.1 hypothetical protein B0G74_1349 [Paraburkholderia sp. BL9I2N2]
MIDVLSAARIAAHAYHKGASKFASRFDGILCEVDRQSSRVVDPASGDPGYRSASGRFDAVVADKLLHAQMPAFVGAMLSNQKDFQ